MWTMYVWVRMHAAVTTELMLRYIQYCNTVTWRRDSKIIMEQVFATKIYCRSCMAAVQQKHVSCSEAQAYWKTFNHNMSLTTCARVDQIWNDKRLLLQALLWYPIMKCVAQQTKGIFRHEAVCVCVYMDTLTIP